MVHNELVLLDQVLEQRQAQRASRMPEDDAFELFACEQALSGREMSLDEVTEGLTGGGNDGGLDGVYVFVGDAVLSEDSELFDEGFAPSSVPTATLVELWMVQAKLTESFSESAIEKVADSARRLLDLAEDESDLRSLYSDPVVVRTGFFRKALRALASRHPKVAIHFVYAGRGRTGEINTKVQIKARDLENQLAGVIPDATGHVRFMGAAELWRHAHATPSYTTQLTYLENATSSDSHIALVRLRDYLAFLSDDQGRLRKHIFDWNVRDYQGSVEVNREIRETLLDETAPEFWWLNNGITLVCSKASAVGKTYSLDDVQVVNGLQTSHTIHDVLSGLPDEQPSLDRAILVRILITGNDAATRDRVIRATNRQTSVPDASLRATDDIQRDIEAYFLHHGWYYDRRKNFYRNNGKSPERIVSIPLLAQAMMAMGLSRPDNSRARPSSLLKRNEVYRTIFSNAIPLEIYLWLAESQKTVDAFLLSDTAGVTTQERTNLRFHLAMVAATKLIGTRVQSPHQLRDLANAGSNVGDADLAACLQTVRACFTEFETQSGDPADKIAKGSEFVEFLLDNVRAPSSFSPAGFPDMGPASVAVHR